MSGLTPERLAEIEALTAKVIEVFGDHWPLEYDTGEDEVVCRYEDEDAPFTDVFIVLFRTSQWQNGKEKTSPLAEFLAASVKVVPALLAEVERRLTAEDVERFLKRERDNYEARTGPWHDIDDVLDTFRLHMVTGTPLTEPRPEGGPEALGVGPEPLTEAEELRAEVERLRAERLTAVATVAKLHRRLTTREREHNADRAEMERLRDAETERNRLRAVLEDLTVSVEHDRDSSACERREARQQREADHNEPCPACTLHTALHPMCTDGAPS